MARRAVTAWKDTFVPDPDVVLQRRVSKSGRITKVFAKAQFTIGAPYTGIAVSARDFTVEFIRERRRFPLKNPMSHLPAFTISLTATRRWNFSARAHSEFCYLTVSTRSDASNTGIRTQGPKNRNTGRGSQREWVGSGHPMVT